MKRLLYLVPFVLIGLSLTPLAIYKDTVNYGSSLSALSPGHWRMLDMQVSFSTSLDSMQEVGPNGPPPATIMAPTQPQQTAQPAAPQVPESPNPDPSQTSPQTVITSKE